MPRAALPANIMSGQANYAATDWAQASASAKLDHLAVAELRRGLNVGLGASALVKVDASVAKFIAASVDAQASATAKVQAQIQVPTDLFSEAGLAIRLQAIAEAAASIQLGIGLSTADFLNLAAADRRMAGAPLRLLELLLEETVLLAGVQAKAAVSAMAYANFMVTGSLLGDKPGLLIAAEAGVGLKAGAGFQVFANFGLKNPHRFVRRSIDIAVDETFGALKSRVPPDLVPAADELRVPAKIAFRAAFELGWNLAQAGGFDPGAGPVLAQQLTSVVLEEGQRFLFESFVQAALERVQKAVVAMAVSDAQWNVASAERAALTTRLGNFPEDPYDATSANVTYWNGLIGELLAVIAKLGGVNPPAQLTEPAAIVWSALQLVMRATERISDVSARGSIAGLGSNRVAAAFDRPLASQPPLPIKRFVNTALGRSANATLDEAALVDFLARDTILTPLIQEVPALDKVLTLIFGPAAGGGLAAAKMLLRQIGAFVPGPGGGVSSEASQQALLGALQAYLDNRLRQELLPALEPALEDLPEARLYLHEVILPTLDACFAEIMQASLHWSAKTSVDQTVVREVCSGLLMKLIGRSLVVSLDVMLDTALSTIGGELRNAAGGVNRSNGLAPFLAGVTGLDRDFLAELLSETLLITAETFTPLPADRRARIRELLYELSDVVPATGASSYSAQLRDDFFIPNAEAAQELIVECGTIIAGNVQRFVTALFTRLAGLVLEELLEILRDVEQTIRGWVRQLEQLVTDLQDAIRDMTRQIAQLTDAAEQAWVDAFDGLEDALHAFASSGNRASARSKVKELVVEQATAALATIDFYNDLPSQARRFARELLRDVIGDVLDNKLFDDVWKAVADLADEAGDIMDDIRDLDLDGNLAAQIGDLLFDRLEDRLDDIFGGSSPKIALGITVKADFGLFKVNHHIDIGRVGIPLRELKSLLRGLVRNLAAFEALTDTLADQVSDAIDAALALAGVEQERDDAIEEKARADKHLEESTRGNCTIAFLSPQPASLVESSYLELEIFLANTPASFLGLGRNQQQRAFVFLNREEMLPDLWTVEERASDRPAFAPIPGLKGASVTLPVDELSERLADVRNLRPLGANASLRFQPGMKVGDWGETFVVGAEIKSGYEGVRSYRSANGKRQAPLWNARLAATAPQNSKPAGVRQHLEQRSVQSAGRAARDALRGISRLPGDKPLLGRAATVFERADFVDRAGDGLLLRLRIEGRDLQPGMNSLAVSIIPGQGPRVEQSISFFVATAVTTPGKPVRPKPGLPITLPGAGVKPGTRPLLGGVLPASLVAYAAAAPLVRPAVGTKEDLDRLAAGWFTPKAMRRDQVKRLAHSIKAKAAPTADRLAARSRDIATANKKRLEALNGARPRPSVKKVPRDPA